MIHSGVLRLLRVSVAIVMIAMTSGRAQSDHPTLGRLVPVATPSKARDPSLTAFLDRLREVVRKRDAKGLLSLVVDDIDVDFGRAKGKEAFAEAWELPNPKSRFWHDIGWLIEIGAPYVEWGDYCLPYALAKLPKEFDLRHGAIVQDRVTMRAEPSAKSPVLATLSYDIVTLDTSSERDYDRHPDDFGAYGAPWVKIALPDGQRGYVRQESIWPVASPRFCIHKIHGEWRIIDYAVGD